MGKAKQQRRKDRKAKKSDPYDKDESGRVARAKAAVALLHALEQGDVDARVQACIALGNMFDDPEKSPTVIKALSEHNAFRVLVDRVCDSDQQVRLHACGALSTIARAGGPRLCGRLACDGVPTAALSRLTRSDESLETQICAVDLLCDLSNMSEQALGIFQDASALATLFEVLGKDELGEEVARLLHIVTENNESLSRFILEAGRVSSLESAVVACHEQGLSKLKTELHVLGALGNIARYSANLEVLDIAKVCTRAMDMCTSILTASTDEEGVGEVRLLVLEVLTNICASIDLGHQEQRNERCADILVHSKGLLGALGVILKGCEEQLQLESPDGVILQTGTHVCGLVDNIIQNTSVVLEMNPQEIWQTCYRLFGLLTMRQDNTDGVEEEFTDAVSALGWSTLRRLHEIPGCGFTFLNVHIQGIQSVFNSKLSATAKANLVGVFGTLGCPGAISLEGQNEALHVIGRSLSGCIADASVVVFVQAVDSIIDMFGDDTRDALFDQLQMFSALRRAVPRMQSFLQDPHARIDRVMLENVFENLQAFLEYKTRK
mmetsp:Transcript_7400/g.11855  ORF Transcript_7400/g.11855 Transcript_7400/m.11855 type:complete len:551 (-) Transcript_7400:265-1917(-)|eukprot:CAMPEP_0203747938 /NCGR_PEP_ID=MMETSP0098-20131031/2947_1 /ASSEMBLY_ACC=CAM_ASM_000208 /TAXON_ID=96639 /ORGANISM=" , Strain NY0313808BC1" /LENGTH=550 /DNA_ID=CAMNT_0050636525 /DNA_START=1766 /DNA_END=3418 /DNA_ORIENTATION=+